MNIEAQVSEVLKEFAQTFATDFPVQVVLDRLIGRIVEILPITAAGLTLISPGVDPRHVAASNDLAWRFEQLQIELGEGPCLLAYQTGAAVTVADLAEEARFAAFTSRALREGLVAVFAFPLRAGDHRLGALDLYRTTAGPLDSDALAAAQTLADVAAGYLLSAQAYLERQELSERAEAGSLHDVVTGLPSRALLIERLDHAVLRGRRSKKAMAIIFADFDRFWSFGEVSGRPIGDELLAVVAQRLTRVVRTGDTVARFAGGEFVILCEDLDDPSEAGPLAVRISTALAEPVVLSDVEVQPRLYVGIAFAGRGDEIPDHVLQDAATAMERARPLQDVPTGIIDLRPRPATDRRASLNRDLHGALLRGELRVVYQPIVVTTDRRITGVEALLRWAHPTLGTVGPETVVPLAEQNGLISEIGRWVLEQACVDRRRWQSAGHPALGISVNVSALQLVAPDFAATVADVLHDTHTDPGSVTLEVTESVFIADGERAQQVLDDLKTLGVLLAVDDFGTGYSSLSYLKRFPVDIVKIDRSFVADLDRDTASRLIVAAIVGLAHGLHMTVVAEGVESVDQHLAVTALLCDSCQGFYFGRPAPAATLDPVMAAGAA